MLTRTAFGIFLLCCFNQVFAQTTSDCDGAISVCDGYYEETSAPLTTGTELEIPFGSCNPTESNSIWYIFTVQEDGFFSFILEPNDDNNDYDWGLYDISENGCDGISSGNSPEVSCNSWGVAFGANGPTGISTANGGTGNSNGPGDLNGPPFNADLPVTAGTTFALAVMNWSASPDGYTLDFQESTATIYDDIPPSIVSVTPDCSGSEITVVFSENILTESMQLIDFSVTGPGGDYGLSNFIAEDGATATSDDTFIFQFNDPMTDSGTYTFILEEGADFVQDACGNSASGSVDFEVSGLMNFSTILTPACNGEGGIIEITDITGGTEPFSYELNNASEADGTFEDLGPGNYSVTLTDNNDCDLTLQVTVENFELWVDAGPDSIPCALNFQLEGTFNAGTFEWTYPSEITVNDNTLPNSLAFTTVEGLYTFTATATLGECIVTDVVNVTFSTPLNPEITTMRTSCHAVCDGYVDVVSNAGVITAVVNELSLPGTELHFDGLCANTYEVFVTDFAGCTYSETIEIIEPPVLIADFEATPQPIEVPESTITFTNLSVNDSVSYWVFGDPMLGESFDSSAVFEFPMDVGGVYDVVLFVTDGFGCVDSIMKQVIIEDNFMVFVPNSFTPNNDGINDIFQIAFSYDPNEYLLTIFNRWGEPVFISGDFKQAWTGNVNYGEHFARDGVYNWVLEVRGNELEKRFLTGHVTIIR